MELTTVSTGRSSRHSACKVFDQAERQIIDGKGYAASQLLKQDDPRIKAFWAGEYIAYERMAQIFFGTSQQDYMDAISWAKREAKLD